MNKRIIVVLLTLSLWLIGCSTSESPPEDNSPDITDNSNESEKRQIALVMKTLTNPFFVEMEKGARQAETELGIELLVRTGAQETSVDQQINIIETLIEDGVDAIVIAPADSVALIPILKTAQDAGIVIVNIDNRLDPDSMAQVGLTNVPFISVDNVQGGYLSAQHVAGQIEEPTQVAILEGIRSAQNAEDRRAGAVQAFDENDNIEVVASETANWKIDEAYNVTKQIFTDNPEIGAIFAANDMMALGAIQYLEENGRQDVLIASYDALDEAKEAIRAGTMSSTIDQQAARQGYIGVVSANQMLDGEATDTEIFVDVLLVTDGNVDE